MNQPFDFILDHWLIAVFVVALIVWIFMQFNPKCKRCGQYLEWCMLPGDNEFKHQCARCKTQRQGDNDA